MTIPKIIDAAWKLELNARNSEVQELAGLVRRLASETNESLEFLTKTKADLLIGLETADQIAARSGAVSI